MDPKFVKLPEAAQQLGITAERINQLREEGKLRAYRDGGSWKFRVEEIAKMAQEGVPSAEESDLSLSLDDFSLDLGGSPSSSPENDAPPQKPALEIDEPDELELAVGSDAELTVELGEDLDLEEDDDADSILLSEAELGDSPDRPPSTIIGKGDLDSLSDLDLGSPATDEDVDITLTESGIAGQSDVQLVDLEDLEIDAGATGEFPSGVESPANFDDIEELELGLDAESSRLVTPQEKQPAPSPEAALSDLELEQEDTQLSPPIKEKATDTSTSTSADQEQGSDIGLAGGSSLSVPPADDDLIAGLSALELDDEQDDDFVLSGSSHATLSPADSGINLTPVDSGLSLDDAALDLGGSGVGSGLDLDASISSMSGLLADEPPEGAFELTPMADDLTDSEDDNSHMLGLDAFEEEQGAEDLLESGDGRSAMLAPAAIGPGGGVATVMEAQFSGWMVFFLSLCLLLLSLCGMMTIDLIHNIWSWDQPYQINSSLIDSLTGLFF